jgi:segregation and condensation protein B
MTPKPQAIEPEQAEPVSVEPEQTETVLAEPELVQAEAESDETATVEASDGPSEAGEQAAFAAADLPPEELHAQALRVVEALIFASAEALTLREIAKRLPKSVDVKAIVAELEEHYSARGVTLVRIAGKVAFRTAADVADRLKIERVQSRKLSRAALETLAIIAYQTAEDKPVTRSEIEEIRGVALSKGTLEVLMEAEFVGPKGNRETPGRPVTYAVTDRFLEHFGLDSIKALPGIKELRDLGLLDTRPAVSAYSEDSGLSSQPELGAASEDETGPIDDREMVREPTELVLVENEAADSDAPDIARPEIQP